MSVVKEGTKYSIRNTVQEKAVIMQVAAGGLMLIYLGIILSIR